VEALLQKMEELLYFFSPALKAEPEKEYIFQKKKKIYLNLYKFIIEKNYGLKLENFFCLIYIQNKMATKS